MKRRFAILVGSIFVLLGCARCNGCRGCNQQPALATLIALQGSAERDHAGKAGVWSPAAVSSTFSFGDGFRTSKLTKARIELLDGSMIKLGSSTQIRFRTSVPHAGETGLDVQTGEALIESGEKPLRLRLQQGVATVSPGSSVRLVPAGKGRVGIEVSVGRAVLDTRQGSRRSEAGDRFEISIGGAILETKRPPPPAAAPPPPRPAPPAAAPSTAANTNVTATVHVHSPRVQTRRSEDAPWQKQKVGAAVLPPGTQLRLPPGGRVEVARGGQKANLQGSGQYTIEPPERGLVSALSGQMEVQAEGENAVILVPGGVIVAHSSADGGATRGALAIRPQGTQVETLSGRIDLDPSGDKPRETLQTGEKAVLSNTGSLEIGGRGPPKVVFYVPAGESFAVRDPQPPTEIGFQFGGKCPQGGVVEVARSAKSKAILAVSGQGRSHLLVPVGSFRYRLRCHGSAASAPPEADGAVRILRDSGKTKLPASAPSTLVDTDGRRYTVIYQNLLPTIVVQWPDAPAAKAGGYKLHVQSSSGKSSQHSSAAQAKIELAAGTLGEGSHRLSFATADGARSSRPAELSIRFDNVAPTASLARPDNRSFAAGSSVAVQGITLEGWDVSVLGSKVPLDGQRRFSAQVQVPAEQIGFAVRLAHPQRGVQYYLRRTGSP